MLESALRPFSPHDQRGCFLAVHLMIAGSGEVIDFVRTELRQMWQGEASVISYDELELLMQQHLVAIITLLALLIVVLVLDLVMA